VAIFFRAYNAEKRDSTAALRLHPPLTRAHIPMNESCLDKLAHKVGPKLAHTLGASMDFVARPDEIRRYVEAVQERNARTVSVNYNYFGFLSPLICDRNRMKQSSQAVGPVHRY
jgi:hypothetical protein